MEETGVVMAESDGVPGVLAFISFLFVRLLHFGRTITDAFPVPVLSEVLLGCFHNVVSESPHLKGTAGHKRRLSIAAKDMFQVLTAVQLMGHALYRE